MSEPVRRSRRLVKEETAEDGPSTSKYFPEPRQVKVDDQDDISRLTAKGTAGPSHARSRRDPSDSPTKPRKRVKLEQPQGRSASSPLTDLEEIPPHLRLQSIPIKVDKVPSASKGKKPIVKLKLEKPHPAPKNWETQYRLIERMRAKIVAPVDTLGCDTPNGERTSDPRTVRFHILISLMLSSQTRDPVTSQAVTNLHDRLPGGLTAEALAAAPSDLVADCISKVGFWRRKTEYIQEAARAIVEGGLDDGQDLPEGWEGRDLTGVDPDGRAGDVPMTLGGLCKLKGVGPKMAFLALQCAWNINAGVGVDVHVHRLTNRLGWHKPKTTDPEQTRLNLQSWLPPHLFKPINHVLVGFGQVVCLPVGPRCDVCLLAKEKICPARVTNGNYKGRKAVGVSFEEEDEITVKAEPKLEIELETTVKAEPKLEIGLEAT